MATFQQYILSVVAAASICGILSSLVRNTSANALVNLVCGLILTLTVIRPIADIDLSVLETWESSFKQDASYYRDLGTEEVKQAISERIKAESEAYVLAEATRLNADISVEILLDEESIPKLVYLRGNISPSARQQMEAFLETGFAISKENQIWTG